MEREYTAVIEKRAPWYVDYVEEIPGVNTQGRTLPEARRNLRDAPALILEVNREIAGRSRSRTVRRESITVEVQANGMKRRDLLRHMASHGCLLFREGGRHSVFLNPKTNPTSVVPRHKEINEYLATKICRDLAIPKSD